MNTTRAQQAANRTTTGNLEAWVQKLTTELADAYRDLETQTVECRRLEQALSDAELRSKLLFESNPNPMFIYEMGTLSIIAVNQAAVCHYGYSREEFLTMTMKDLRPAEGVPALLETISKADAGLRRMGIWRHRKKDGTIVEMEITSHPITYAGRQARLVLANDVSERRQIEGRLKQRERQYQSLVETTNEWIWAIDREGRVTYSNPAIEAILGHRPEELLGHSCVPLMHEEDWRHVEPLFTQWVEQKRGWTGVVLRWRHKDGTYRWLESTAVPIIAPNGELIGYRGADRDITERKLLEAQLRQAQKMEAVGRLAGGVAHDFNNLLTAIKGYSELVLARLSYDDPLRGQIEEIKKAGDRAASLTRQLLAFSRNQSLQPTVLDLNAVVSDMHKMLKRLIGEDIDLKLALEPTLGTIKADPGQVEQVIMNLAVNARDAMPQGGKLIIETANVVLDENYARRHIGIEPGRYVMLAVSDTGCGMDDETLSHIFEPFFTTKQEGQGTGLGLSTVYGIVKQSGGHIWVYSEPGRSTTFKVYFPRTEEAVVETAHATPDQPECQHQGQETILLVEDEEMVRTLASEILQMNGYTVLEAEHGEAAIQLSRRFAGRIHLMLTDVVMPEMSGVELARRLTSDRPEMKVVYMSGYTDRAVAHHGLLELDSAYLQKPFTLNTLTCKIRQVLEADRR